MSDILDKIHSTMHKKYTTIEFSFFSHPITFYSHIRIMKEL